MTDLTVYDLMGEDHYVSTSYDAASPAVDVKIYGPYEEVVFHEESHVFAWRSLVHFAKQIIACDEQMKMEELTEII
jgi:archaeosine-15-forming tRNA-guanine transglycosylase